MTTLDWIAVDWGTSRLRAWAMGVDDVVLCEASSDSGMGGLSPGQFEAALLSLIGDWLPVDRVTDVVACGMVGARQGWTEARYMTTPCPPLHPAGVVQPGVTDRRLNVRIIPGLRQNAPADVMRGEETQIAGFLENEPDFDGLICLPGTHSKWAKVTDGVVTSFATFMTGELFAALSAHTVLRHAMGDKGGTDWDDDAFADAIVRAFKAPEALTTQLFSIRANGLLHGLSPGSARATLSGMLIGGELSVASAPDSDILLLGDDTLCDHYQKAISLIGRTARTASASAATLNGLISARRFLR